jgi:uncharacterized membrane protein (UPF0127 family)
VLHLVEAGVRAGRVPGLGRDVDPVDGVEDLVVSPAALARPRHGAGRYRRLLPLLLVLLAAACSSSGGSAPSTASVPAVTGTVATLPGGAVPSGFEAVTLRITAADGSVHESCVLIAASEADRARGLMDVDSLGGYDGMIFRFGAPTSAQFYMFHTKLPLSVAFFDGSGAFVSSSDMAPCAAAASGDCPVYSATGRYVDALEVVQGGLAPLGIGPGARIRVGAQCSRSP